MPERIQLRRTKGWRMPENTVKVCRPGVFGNPFPVDIYSQEKAVDLHRRWLMGCMSMGELDRLSRYPTTSMVLERKTALAALPSLRGKNLACWCPVISHGDYCHCHADVLLEIANKPAEGGRDG